MLFREVFERFAKSSPVSVMPRALLEHALPPEFVDDLFARHAKQQRPSPLLFSVVVELLSLVVCRVKPSLHAAYQDREQKVPFAVKSVYNKLNGAEPQVARHLVRETAQRFAAAIDALGVQFPALVPGFRSRILDGNHLAATEHRLKELRHVAGGPLPGQSLVVLCGDRRLVLDVYPCEDAYTQERVQLLEVLQDVEAGELWIADRAFCTAAFMCQVAAQKAFFLVRQHATNVPWQPKEPHEPRRYVGRTASGEVYEQNVTLDDGCGGRLDARRVTIVLDQPTKDGDGELQLLTNLPETVSAVVIAEAYRGRWRIEGAFGELDLVLDGEIDTLAHPPAALLAFCLALLAYNLLRVVRASLASVHGVEKIEKEVSSYYLGLEISSVSKGLAIAVPDDFWTAEYGRLTASELANCLRDLARQVDLRRYRKHGRGPKKPRPPRKSSPQQPHVSTARILAQRNPRK